MLSSARRLLTVVGSKERKLAVDVLAPALITNPHLPGVTSRSWSSATVAATVRGDLQAASLETLDRLGRVGASGVFDLYLDPVALSPDGRVRVLGRTFTILDSREHGSHTHALVEEVSA